MPPQQPDRLLDFGDDGLDFGSHNRDQISGVGEQVSTTAKTGPDPCFLDPLPQ
jgi:hypothetical protein